MKKYITLNTPTALFTEPAYANLSNNARLLYALFLDREDYSRKNGWLENERVFFIYTIEEIMDFFRCAKGTAVKLKQELESVGLLEQVKGGFNKPTKLFLSPLETEQVYEVDSELSSKNEPYLIKTNIKNNTKTVDSKTPEKNRNAGQSLNKNLIADFVATINNSNGGTFLSNQVVQNIIDWTNDVLVAKDWINTIYTAKYHAEKKAAHSFFAEEYADKINKTMTRVITAFKGFLNNGKKINNAKGFIFKSFAKEFEEIANLDKLQLESAQNSDDYSDIDLDNLFENTVLA